MIELLTGSMGRGDGAIFAVECDRVGSSGLRTIAMRAVNGESQPCIPSPRNRLLPPRLILTFVLFIVHCPVGFRQVRESAKPSRKIDQVALFERAAQFLVSEAASQNRPNDFLFVFHFKANLECTFIDHAIAHNIRNRVPNSVSKSARLIDLCKVHETAFQKTLPEARRAQIEHPGYDIRSLQLGALSESCLACHRP